MTDAPRSATAERARRPVVITGLAATSAFGRGLAPLLRAACAGSPAFRTVRRFDVSRRRAKAAAELPGAPRLLDELTAVTEQACAEAGLAAGQRAVCPLLLAGHADPLVFRSPSNGGTGRGAGALAAALAKSAGLGEAPRAYTNACVAASTAVVDAAVMITTGHDGPVVVAAAYLVDADYFTLFDVGGALSDDGSVRPFSAGRRGMLLGDAAVAVVLESEASRRRRGVAALAELVGWGRAGDAYHVCRPSPDGTGMARAISSALRRARLRPADLGYINANGTGTEYSDAAESAGLRLALGEVASEVPISSTKSVHGHALEASALLELAVTVHALRDGALPVNAGFAEPDEGCRLNLVLGGSTAARSGYALSVNGAFGGANTALLVGAR